MACAVARCEAPAARALLNPVYPPVLFFAQILARC